MKLKTNQMSGLRLVDEMIMHLVRGGPEQQCTMRAKKGSAAYQLFDKYAPLLGLVRTGSEFSIPSESGYSALYLARASLECLYDYDSKLMNFPIESQLSFFNIAKTWSKEVFVSYAKYITCWPMARFISETRGKTMDEVKRNRNEDLPVTPSGFVWNPLLYSNPIKKYLKARVVSKSYKNFCLWVGIIQGVKRGAAPLGSSAIRSAMVKHWKSLTKESVLSWADENEIGPYIERFFSSFRPRVPKLSEASVSASYERTRSEGGGRDYIRSIMKDFYLDDELLSMHLVNNKVEEIRGLPMVPLPDILKTLDIKELSQWTSGFQKVMVSAILEPLKCRLITKGSAVNQWISRSMQKDLWGYLQKFPQFSLTGKPLVIGDLEDLRKRSNLLDLPFNKWVSGDYSAATDNLVSQVTKDIFEEALSKLEGNNLVKDIMRHVLYEQEIHYPKKYVDLKETVTLEPVVQKTGQLMGSVLSFPILCAANLIAYWMSLETYTGRKFLIEDLPVLVNGDDIIFRANDDFYEIWKRNVAIMGFELSLGKNYISERFLTINSQFYMDTDDSLRKAKFLNTGLLTGQSKITGRMKARMAPLWDYYNEVIPSSIDPLRSHRRFIHYNKERISKLTDGQFNLFASFQKGGLGFKIPQGLDPKFTNFQRRVGTWMKEKHQEMIAVGNPKISKICLVQEREAKVGIVKESHSEVMLVPRLTPYVGKPFEKELIEPPPLSQAYELIEPDLKVVSPSGLFRGFHQAFNGKGTTINRMGDSELMEEDKIVISLGGYGSMVKKESSCECCEGHPIGAFSLSDYITN